jgi:uncharacterized protein YndB with AHSA1/START domain
MMNGHMPEVQLPEPQALSGVPRGTVQVSVRVPMPAERVWPALTRRDLVGQWFGDLSDSLRPGGVHRLDFGDGDFFEIFDVVLDPPGGLSYNWRFLGTGPSNAITWQIKPVGGESVVTVTDREDNRDQKTVNELIEGWTDFLGRLQEYGRTGRSTRYGWRQEFDGSIELPAEAATAAGLLLSAIGQSRWMPWSGGALARGATVTTKDGLQPSRLTIGSLERTGNLGLRFTLACPQWRAPTECAVELQSRPVGVLLVISHTGWPAISDDDHERSVQRERFGRLWTKALLAAQEIVGASRTTSRANEAFR